MILWMKSTPTKYLRYPQHHLIITLQRKVKNTIYPSLLKILLYMYKQLEIFHVKKQRDRMNYLRNF